MHNTHQLTGVYYFSVLKLTGKPVMNYKLLKRRFSLILLLDLKHLMNLVHPVNRDPLCLCTQVVHHFSNFQECVFETVINYRRIEITLVNFLNLCTFCNRVQEIFLLQINMSIINVRFIGIDNCFFFSYFLYSSKYCKSGNNCENLIFTNIRQFIAS